MTLKKPACYSYKTHGGVFYIRQQISGAWEIVLGDDCLGRGYASAQNAIDDLCGGHTFSCDAGDTSELGIPDEISEWRKC